MTAPQVTVSVGADGTVTIQSWDAKGQALGARSFPTRLAAAKYADAIATNRLPAARSLAQAIMQAVLGSEEVPRGWRGWR